MTSGSGDTLKMWVRVHSVMHMAYQTDAVGGTARAPTPLAPVAETPGTEWAAAWYNDKIRQ